MSVAEAFFGLAFTRDGYITENTYNHFHNGLRLFEFYQIFFSPQVEQCAITTYKHGIYELPHELSNDLRLRISGNQEIPRKFENLIERQPSAHSPCQNENFVNTSKKS